MKLAHYITTGLFIGLSLFSSAQNNEVEQYDLAWSNNMRACAHLDFLIPYAQLDDTRIPAIITIDFSYNLKQLAELRASAHVGSFKGATIGGMYMLKNKMLTRKTKFKISETSNGRTKTLRFYKGNSEFKRVFGPSVDMKFGSFDNTGTFTRFQAGLEWKTFSQAYYKDYASTRNGYQSVKLQAIASTLNMWEHHNGKQAYNPRFGMGAMASVEGVFSPWKRVSMFVGLDLGYLFIPGVEDDKTNGIENDKGMPILEIKLGAAVKL